MTATTTREHPAMASGAVYWSDNGRAICARCAGASARYTGRDISGQRIERVTAADAAGWPSDLGPLSCECGAVTLSTIIDAAGHPVAT